MTEKPENEGIFSRWSRRKLDTSTNLEPDDSSVEPESTPSPEVPPINEESISAEDEQPLPLWQQPDADPEAKKSALSALFHQPEFHEVDRMNEYDEDFTQFSGLGNIVTQEMKRMLKLAEEKTRPDEAIVETNVDPEKPDSRLTEITPAESEPENDNEEDEIA